MVAPIQFKFKGTKEQFVDWLKGNVRHGIWPAPGYQLMEDEYINWLQWLQAEKPLFIETYPFEPPPSFDFPFTLEIRGRIGRVQPMEDWDQACLLCEDPLRHGESWQDVVRPFCTRCWRKAEGDLDLPPEPKGGGGLLYSRLRTIAFLEVHYPIPEGILIGQVDFVWGADGYLAELLKKLERDGWLEWPEAAEKRSAAIFTENGMNKMKPPPPDRNADSDEWFDWFHTVTDELGYKMTLRELASEIGLSYDYVRHLHAEYMAQHNTKKTQR